MADASKRNYENPQSEVTAMTGDALGETEPSNGNPPGGMST